MASPRLWPGDFARRCDPAAPRARRRVQSYVWADGSSLPDDTGTGVRKCMVPFDGRLELTSEGPFESSRVALTQSILRIFRPSQPVNLLRHTMVPLFPRVAVSCSQHIFKASSRFTNWR